MSVTTCSICGKPVMDGNKPIGDIVDMFKYDFDGSLDYIMLLHRQCALRKGYKIKDNRVVTGHWAERGVSEGYIIVKGSRDSDTPYAGPACDTADVPRGKVYADKAEALRDAAKLQKVNPVGFMVRTESVQPMREAATPNPKLHFWLVSAVTEYDRKQEGKPGFNRYALPQYLKAIDDIEQEIREGASIRWAVEGAFIGRLQTFVLKWLEKQGAQLDEHFSFGAASNFVGAQGKGKTLGYNQFGGVVVIAPGRVPLAQLRKDSTNKIAKAVFYPPDAGAPEELRESQQVGEYPQVNEMLPEPREEEVRRVAGRFQVVDRKGKPVGGTHPSYSAAQKADQAAKKRHYQEDVKRVPFKYSVERVPGTLDYRIVDTKTRKPADKGTWKTKDYDGDDLDARRAAESRCAQMNRDWADAQEGPVQMREQAKDMTGIKCTKCKRGTYKETSQMDDMDGVLHCSKCGHEVQRWQESADAVTAISKNESALRKRFGTVILEMAPVNEVSAPGQESWIKKNKERFKKEYGAKKGTEVLYATAWKRSKGSK